MAVEDLEDVRVGDAGEAAVGEHGADGFAVGAGAAFERVNDGQRCFAFAQVAGGGLAEDVVVGGEVEDVIDDLEGEAEVAAILAERCPRRAARRRERRGSAIDRAELHGDLEEARGLAIDEVEVLFLVDQVAELFHLQQLAFDHLLGERDEQIEDAEVAFVERGLEGLHVEPVAGEHALGVAPGGVGGGRPRRVLASSMMSSWTSVAVCSISTTAPRRMRASLSQSSDFGGEQQQQRANALAAAGDEVVGDVGDDGDGRGGLACELALNGGEIVLEEVEDFSCRRDGDRAHVA